VSEFLEFVIRQLVEFPDEVLITQGVDGEVVFFKVEVRKSDIGRVIGKNGHTIHAIRNIMDAAASRHNQRVAVDVVEEPE
jgi:predicted RNA-binding protein YlqC (UPF0109 family)